MPMCIHTCIPICAHIRAYTHLLNVYQHISALYIFVYKCMYERKMIYIHIFVNRYAHAHTNSNLHTTYTRSDTFLGVIYLPDQPDLPCWA